MSAATTISPSTTTSSSPPQDPPSRTWIPTSTPITLLPTPTARLYHHIHPILLLSLFYLSFPALTAHPVSTLSKLLLPITSLQILYCVLCLPIAKAGVLRVNRKPKPKPGVKKPRELGIVWEKVVVSFPIPPGSIETHLNTYTHTYAPPPHTRKKNPMPNTKFLPLT